MATRPSSSKHEQSHTDCENLRQWFAKRVLWGLVSKTSEEERFSVHQVGRRFQGLRPLIR